MTSLRWLVALLLILGVGVTPRPVSTGPRADAAPGGPPNVVVILTDDERWDQMPYMPITDSLLELVSVNFTRALVTTPLCCPSRSSILTGLYSHNTGVLTNNLPNGGASRFDPSSTIATWLHAAGYRTSLIGKYLNDLARIAPAVPPGWDDFQAFIEVGGKRYYKYTLNENGRILVHGNKPADYSTVVFASKAVAFINSTPANQPLFLLFAPTAPHEPATPYPSDSGRYARFPAWRPPSYNEANVRDKTTYVRAMKSITDQQMTKSDAFHRRQLEALQAVDRAVGDIVAALRRTSRWDNTLVIFLSDNGLSWGEHRILDVKSCPYDECIRVPLFLRVPGVPARQDTSLVANIDLAPTIAEWAGVTPPGHVNGASLRGLARDPGTPWRTALLVEQLGLPRNRENFQGVRTSRYLYNTYLNGEKELYDLMTDPYQLTNVVKKRGYASTVASLSATLDSLRRQ